MSVVREISEKAVAIDEARGFEFPAGFLDETVRVAETLPAAEWYGFLAGRWRSALTGQRPQIQLARNLSLTSAAL